MSVKRGVVMGDIGPVRREIEVLPLREPSRAPVVVPEREPEKVPA